MGGGCGAGAGFGGGFWAGVCPGLCVGLCVGLCAKTGEAEPAASAPARKAAKRVRTSRVTECLCSRAKMAGLEIASERKSFRVPQRVFMMIMAPRDSVPKGRFCLYLPSVERGPSACCYTWGPIYSFREGLRLDSGREKGFSRGIRHSLTQKAATDLGAVKITASSLISVPVP
jgi:hypothetical protein